jgi:hypothetical protein
MIPVPGANHPARITTCSEVIAVETRQLRSKPDCE